MFDDGPTSKELKMFSTEYSRMYAALRCIETELKESRPSMNRIRTIMKEASRVLGGPSPHAPVKAWTCPDCGGAADDPHYQRPCEHKPPRG